MSADAVEVPTRMLVHALVRADGTVDGGELYAVAGALGMSDPQVRLCVARLVRDGRFAQSGRGRRATLTATEETRRELAPDVGFVRFAYRQDAGEAPWDERWRLVAFAVPESERSARDALREAIGRFGGAQVQGGLYVSPNRWEPLVEGAARDLGLLGAVTFASTGDLRVGTERDPRRLAAALWPLDAIAARHRRLLEVTRPRLRRLARPDAVAPEEALAIEMELIAEFTRAMEPDPLLPPELLPRPWPGREARALVAEAWAALDRRADRAGAPRLFDAYSDAIG